MCNGSLVVIATHPIQYHAPVYRLLQEQFGIPVTVIYGSDFSIAGYRDREFGSSFQWDTDLVSGYRSRFLSQIANGGARSADEVKTKGLWKALREASPNAVLLTGYSPRFHRAAAIASWMTGVPLLFRAETTDHTQNRAGMKACTRRYLLRRLYGGCARILYVGQQSYHHFRRLGTKDHKLLFSPYCVDTSAFHCAEHARAQLRPAARDGLGIAQNERVLLFSGKISARKGPDVLIQAVRALSADFRNAITVLFLGSGHLQTELERLAGVTPRVNVRFVGFQNQTSLSPYYHAADLLVLPSRHSETWGLVVNEALHHGVPCVVSEAVGCAPDLIKPGITGEITETNSVDGLKAALCRAFSLTDRPDVRIRCREQVSGYSVQKAAAGIAEAYWATVGRS
jgi:glycosyltransferase involved in cell wall biosynthesis